MKFEGMIIGVPTEIMHGEGRVSSTPETVKKMVDEGATVLVQKGAGNKSFFSDEQYLCELDALDEKGHIPSEVSHGLKPLLILLRVLCRGAVHLIPVGR